MSRPFPFGIHLGFIRTIPLPDRIAMLRDAGYDCASSWWPEVDGEMRKLRDAVPDALRNAGLAIDHIHVPYRGCDALWSDDETARHACIEYHLRFIDDCTRHAIPRLVMHVTLKTRFERILSAGINSMKQIVDYASEREILICIENTRRIDPIADLLDAIPSPALGLCYDNAHDSLHGASPGELLDRYAHRLATTHLSDNDAKRDQHWLPGDGVLDCAAVCEVLANPQINSACIIEAVTKDEPEAFLRRGIRQLEAYCKVLEAIPKPSSRASDSGRGNLVTAKTVGFCSADSDAPMSKTALR